METTEAVKIITPERLSYNTHNPNWVLHYPVGEWVKPRYGRIFVFRSMYDAQKSFGRGMAGYLAVKCLCRGLEEPNTVFYVPGMSFNWAKFWFMYYKNVNWENPPNGVFNVPIGTMFAKEIKCLN